VPLGGPWACTYDYLPWFYMVSNPYVISPKKAQPPRGPVRLLPVKVQPLAGYVLGGDYSCKVMQIGFC